MALGSCNRNPEPQVADSVSVADNKIVEEVDTTPQVVADTSGRRGRLRFQVALQQDTAEVTNLRIFARKQRTIYSPQLMIGEWLRENEHEQYIADGTGNRWDTGEDIYREEAQKFSWTMDSNLLTIKYTMALGGVMLRHYVVTFVDDETLVYRDAYGDSYMWEKTPAGFNDRPVMY